MMSAGLWVNQGKNEGQRFLLDKEKIILGRNPDCDMVLEVGAVSRRHARIRHIDGLWYIEDLKSRNGTFLDGIQIEGAVELTNGAEIRICDLAFTFEQLDPDAPVSGSGQTSSPVMMVDDAPSNLQSAIMSKVDISPNRKATPWAIRPEIKLQALLEIGHQMGGAVGSKKVLPKLIESLFTVFPQADRGFIVLEDVETGQLRPVAVVERGQKGDETVRISQTIVREVMQSQKAVLSADAADDSRFDSAQSVVDFHIRSMICAPLVNSDGQSMGVIQIDTVRKRSRFDEEDLDVLASVAGQVASAVENSLLHEEVLKKRAFDQELAIAHEVQQGFLPLNSPEIEQFEFFDYYEPANQLGGDYFDYLELPDERLAIVLADVSGKGISAALLAARLSAEIRYQLAGGKKLSEAMEQINRVFCESRWEDRFITMVVAILDKTRCELTLANAGHLPPLRRTREGEVQRLGESISSLPLGVAETTPYPTTAISLAPGESVTFYSDGITEAMNFKQQIFSQSRLEETLSKGEPEVELLGESLLDRVKKFVGNQVQSDDICLVMIGRTP